MSENYKLVIQRVIDKICNSLSESQYSEWMSDIYAGDEKYCDHMFKQLKTVISRELTRESEYLAEQEDVYRKLDGMEEIIKSQSTSRSHWRPNGDIHDTLRSHVMMVMEQEDKLLNQRLTELRKETARKEELLNNKKKEFLESKTQCT